MEWTLRQKPLFIVAGTILITWSNFAFADDVALRMQQCNAGLVPNELKSFYSNSMDEGFREAMCGSWFNSHHEQADSSVAGGISVLNVGLSGSSQYSKEVKTISRTEYCENKNYKVTSFSNNEVLQRIVPERAHDNWAKCMHDVLTTAENDSSPPIKVKLRPFADEGVLVSVKYVHPLPAPNPKLLNISNALGLVCDPAAHGWFGRSYDIPSEGNGTEIICKWIADDVSVGSVTVQTNHGDYTAGIDRPLKPYVHIDQIYYAPKSTVISTVPNKCTDWMTTVDMDGWHRDKGDRRCNALTEDKNWCKGKYNLTLKKDPGHTVLRDAHLDCNDGKSGSCGWNSLGEHSWFTSNLEGISVEFWFGSLTAHVRLCATQDTFQDGSQQVEIKSFDMPKRRTFSINVPANQTHVLRVSWFNGSSETIPAGRSNRSLPLIHEAGDETHKEYTYWVAEWASPQVEIAQNSTIGKNWVLDVNGKSMLADSISNAILQLSPIYAQRTQKRN